MWSLQKLDYLSKEDKNLWKDALKYSHVFY